MSNAPGRNWQHMKPEDFGGRTKASQDALFLTDGPDACGTDALDGYGFGDPLWADRADTPGADDHPRP